MPSRPTCISRRLPLLSETAANVYIQDLPDFVLLKSNLEGYQFYPCM